MYFIAIDGDLVGRKLESIIISEDLGRLKIFSREINEAVNKLQMIAETISGETYLKGGDSLLIQVNDFEKYLNLYDTIKDQLVASFSIGIGKNVIAAYLALKIAKSSGLGTVVFVESDREHFVIRQI